MLTREQIIRATACPQCGAAIDHSCIGSRGKTRLANHRGRQIYAERAQLAEPAREIAAAREHAAPAGARARAFAQLAATEPTLAARALELGRLDSAPGAPM